jgi:hypothetical protein
MELKKSLKEWTEIEDVLILIGKSLGIYNDSLRLKDFPKHVLWSNSEDSQDIGAMSDVLQVLLKLGAIEERTDKDDLEYRWKPEFKLEWKKLSNEDIPEP